jgi:hypothetical protein
MAAVFRGFERADGRAQEVGVGVDVSAPVGGVAAVGVRAPLPYVPGDADETEGRLPVLLFVDRRQASTAGQASRRKRQPGSPREPPAVGSARRVLPFRLGRQPPAGPGRVVGGPLEGDDGGLVVTGAQLDACRVCCKVQ